VVLSFSLVLASLLTAVVARSLLAEGQVRLGHLQAQVTAAQAQKARDELQVARLEAPARAAGAGRQDHLGNASAVQQVPSVSLSKPLSTIKVSTPTTAPAGAAGGQ
jgi:hypothetical protein